MSVLLPVSIEHLPVGQSSCSRETLTSLANLVDDENGAMTFYFDSTRASTCSHQDENLRLRSLISQARSTLAGGDPRHDIEQELDRLRVLEPQLHRHPRMFHALFVSQKNDFRHYMALPFTAEIGVLHFDRHFELLPLARAFEACAPYAVFLVENGKARGFRVHGDHIEECEALSQSADVNLHAYRERTGWPHGVDRNAEERSDHFFRQLAENACRYVRDIGAEYLIVGCRNAVWNKLQGELTRIGLNQSGKFHLTSFEMTPSEVLEMASAEHIKLQDSKYRAFWDELSLDASHSATQLEDILDCLQQGRVMRLFLGAVPKFDLKECVACGNWNRLDATICTNCKSNAVHITPVAELLLRKALLTHAEVIAPWSEQSNDPHIGALLRY